MNETDVPTAELQQSIRVADGYSELLRVCRAYMSRPTGKGERYLLDRAEKFCQSQGFLEADVMWTIGWDSVEAM